MAPGTSFFTYCRVPWLINHAFHGRSEKWRQTSHVLEILELVVQKDQFFYAVVLKIPIVFYCSNLPFLKLLVSCSPLEKAWSKEIHLTWSRQFLKHMLYPGDLVSSSLVIAQFISILDVSLCPSSVNMFTITAHECLWFHSVVTFVGKENFWVECYSVVRKPFIH